MRLVLSRLLIGVMLSVLVAFACAISQPPGWVPKAEPLTIEQARWWRANAPPGYARDPTATSRLPSRIGQSRRWITYQPRKWGSAAQFVRRVQSGFPMKCLSGGEWRGGESVSPEHRYVRRTIWRVEIRHPNGTRLPVELPLQPIWFGLFIDSLVYGLLFSSCVSMHKWWQIHRRRTQNQCKSCGYPKGGGPRCSECGATLL